MIRPVHAYIAMTPHGMAIPSTIRPTADEAWQELRRSVSEPDSLHDKGWHIRRVVVTVGDIVE
jgi:hypothetical protein